MALSKKYQAVFTSTVDEVGTWEYGAVRSSEGAAETDLSNAEVAHTGSPTDFFGRISIFYVKE